MKIQSLTLLAVDKCSLSLAGNNWFMTFLILKLSSWYPQDWNSILSMPAPRQASNPGRGPVLTSSEEHFPPIYNARDEPHIEHAVLPSQQYHRSVRPSGQAGQL